MLIPVRERTLRTVAEVATLCGVPVERALNQPLTLKPPPTSAHEQYRIERMILAPMGWRRLLLTWIRLRYGRHVVLQGLVSAFMAAVHLDWLDVLCLMQSEITDAVVRREKHLAKRTADKPGYVLRRLSHGNDIMAMQTYLDAPLTDTLLHALARRIEHNEQEAIRQTKEAAGKS